MRWDTWLPLAPPGELYHRPDQVTSSGCPQLCDSSEFFNFFVFFKQNRMELIRAFKEAAKDPRFIRDKAFLDSLVEQLENEMKKYCNLFKDNFTKEQPIIGKLYPYIKPMIDQYTTKK